MNKKSAPPRIPPERRREAVAAATAKANKRGRLRRASPSSKKKASPQYSWLCKPPACLQPLSPTSNATTSSVLSNTTSGLSSYDDERGSSQNFAAPPCATDRGVSSGGGDGSGGGSAADTSDSALHLLARQDSNGSHRGRSCLPPLTRRIPQPGHGDTLTATRGYRTRCAPPVGLHHRADSDIVADTSNVNVPVSPIGVQSERGRHTKVRGACAASEEYGAGGGGRVAAADKYGARGGAGRIAGEVSAPTSPGMVAASDAKVRFEELRMRDGNSLCADCGAPCSDWASVPHGSFVCLKCAGRHRKLGLHVSFTRSLLMDQWSEIHLRRMEVGGNKRLSEFLRLAGLFSWSSIEEKYEHPCLSLYKDDITARAEGESPPPLQRETLEKVVRAARGRMDDDTGEGSLSGFVSSVRSCGSLGDALRRWSWKVGSGKVKGGGGGAPKWVPDDEQEACMLCDTRFTLMRRRHHCRRCGRLACESCAPPDNTRPILEWGLPQAVRHCHSCYRSPLLEWTNVPTRRDGQQQ